MFSMESSKRIPKKVSSWPVERESLLCPISHIMLENGSKIYLMVKECTNSLMAAFMKVNSSKDENKARANSLQLKAILSIKALS